MVKSKSKINVLMNIKSFNGGNDIKLGPILKFVGVMIVPFIIWGLYLLPLIPLKFFLIFEALFGIRMALKIFGRENERLASWSEMISNKAGSIHKLIKVSNIYDDGRIEYTNGRTAYILSGFVGTYFDEYKLSVDLEGVLRMLSDFQYDTACHLVVNETSLQDTTASFDVYNEDEFVTERVEFYIDQDEYCEKHSKLYRINILVKSPKSEYKKLRSVLEDVRYSDAGRVFKSCYVCDKREVVNVLSRDICAYVDLYSLLQEKYTNDNYYGSKVLFYGDDIPDKYKIVKEEHSVLETRITEDD